MCNRRQKGIAQTTVILVLIVCIGYGFYLYSLLQVKVKYLDTKALRHQSQQQSLSSQLQVVYEERARLEKAAQKFESDLEKTKEEKESMIQSMLMEYQDKGQALEKELKELKDKNLDLFKRSQNCESAQSQLHKENEQLKEKQTKTLTEHSIDINAVNVELQNCKFSQEEMGQRFRALGTRVNDAEEKYETLRRLLKRIPVNLISFDHPPIKELDMNLRNFLIEHLGEENLEFVGRVQQKVDQDHVGGNVQVISDQDSKKSPVQPVGSEEEPRPFEAKEKQKQPEDNVRPTGVLASSKEEKIEHKQEDGIVAGKESPKQDVIPENDSARHMGNPKNLVQDLHTKRREDKYQQTLGENHLERPKEGHVGMDIEDEVDEDKNRHSEIKEGFHVDGIQHEGIDDSQRNAPQPVQVVGPGPEAIINPPPAKQDGIDSEEINGQNFYPEEKDVGHYDDDGNQREENDAGAVGNDDDVEGDLRPEDVGMGEGDKVDDDFGKGVDYENEEEDEDEKRYREFRNFKRVMNDKNFMVRNEVQNVIPPEANLEKEI